jgi:magnesium-protoporphyrin IX monomethyl ester (oxidative) cyclase
LRQAGIETSVTYANLLFAERAGLDNLSLIGRLRDDRLVGEWLFSQAAFPDFVGDDQAYLAQIDFSLAEALAGTRDAAIEVLYRTRALAADFVEELAEQIVAERPKVVGTTSMFHQRCSSLALLRRIRELDPSIVTMMGGANCEGTMGKSHFENFDWLDYVVCGEADGLIVALLQDILQFGQAVPFERLPAGVYGPIHRSLPAQQAVRPQVTVLDELPTPEYFDFFEALHRSPLHSRVRPGLLAETSRGCWWGERHHCTFCGLNGTGMNFRLKSPERVLEEWSTLVERHGIHNLELVDNILSMGYFDSLLPALAKVKPAYVLFAETKANLKRSHLEKLATAGIRWIQPGIENLHDQVLQLMDKGCTGLINLQLMKWAREYGVHLTWFYLYGFPGEDPAWYDEVAAWLPLITHLQPPGGMIPVRFDRFSPYHSRSQEYGLNLFPNRSYAKIFPLSEQALSDFAYFFEAEHRTREGAPPDWPPAAFGKAYGAIQEAITFWHERFWLGLPDILHMRDDGHRLTILDTRAVAVSRRHSLEGLSRRVYLACDLPQTVRTCARALEVEESLVFAIVEELKGQRLVLCQSDRVLSLAVRGELPALPRREQFPGGSIRAPHPTDLQPARPSEPEKASLSR